MTQDKHGLVLERCGKRPKRLSKNSRRRSAYGEQLGAGYVTWSETNGVVALHDIKRRRTYRLRFTGGFAPIAVHTRTHIAVSDTLGNFNTSRVYLARIADITRR